MPYVSANGIRLGHEHTGQGKPVLMIMSQAAGGECVVDVSGASPGQARI